MDKIVGIFFFVSFLEKRTFYPREQQHDILKIFGIRRRTICYSPCNV